MALARNLWLRCNNMTIRIKVLSIFLIGFLLMVSANELTIVFVVLPAFQQLEKAQAVNDTERVIRAIQNEVSHIDSLAFDWAAWDDTYDFIQTVSVDYIESNLAVDSFAAGEFHYLGVFDLNNQPVWDALYDDEREQEPKQDFFDSWDNGSIVQKILTDYQQKELSERSNSGILVNPHGIFLVSSRPVITTKNIGPVRGHFILARRLNKALIEKLNEQTQVLFELGLTEEILLPSLSQENVEVISTVKNYLLNHVSDDQSFVYAQLQDVNKINAITLKLVFQRNLLREGKSMMYMMAVSIVVSGLVTLLLLMMMFRSVVVARLILLTEHVRNLSGKAGFKGRLPAEESNCGDEICLLAGKFNEMLDVVENSYEKMQHLNEQLEADIVHRKEVEAKLLEAQARLHELATIDALTGLANRRTLDDELDKQYRIHMREKRALTAILCDIDHFKQYNDFYGHQGGDECLQRVAKVLQESVQRPSDLVARYGGEEFIVLLPYTDKQGGVKVAECILSKLQALNIPHEKSLTHSSVTMSYGVAEISPEEGGGFEQLITLADKNLYIAKEKGRNRVIAG